MADHASRLSSGRASANEGVRGPSLSPARGRRRPGSATMTARVMNAQTLAQAVAGARRELLRAGEAAGLAPETGHLIGVVCRYVTRSAERALFAPTAVAEVELGLALGRVQDAIRACESHYDCAALVHALEDRLHARLDGLVEHIAAHTRGAVDAARREYGGTGRGHNEDHDGDNDNGADDGESQAQVGDEEKVDLFDELRSANHLVDPKDAEIDRLRAVLADCMGDDGGTPQKKPGSSPAALSAVLSDERSSWPSCSSPLPRSSSRGQTVSEAADDDADDDNYDDEMLAASTPPREHDDRVFRDAQQPQQQRLASAAAAARAHKEELREARREAEEQARVTAARAEQQTAAAEERVRAECAAAAAAQQQAAEAELAATRERLDQSLAANGRLYTSLCDLKPNIRVMARVRPALGAAAAELDDLPARPGAAHHGLQRLGVPEKASIMAEVRGEGPKFETFDFERVFAADDTNADVVAAVEPLIGRAIGGRHVCVFAYGQTGTGKSHTMGAADGVIPNAFAMLANWIAARSGTWEYKVEATFVEIYAENCYDLLRNDDDGCAAEKVAVRFDSRRNRATGKVDKFYFAESRRVELTCDGALGHERVQWALDRAARNRRVRATQKNTESSRSHSLLALYIRGTSRTEATEGVLNLIDLAGSERFHVAGAASAEAQAEAIAINKSLSALQKVLGDMANPRATRTSLRESTLTKLLEPCLGDDAKCLMLVMVSPLLKDREETRNTLRFAKGAQQVKLRTIKSTEFGSSTLAQPSPGKAPTTVARLSGVMRKSAASSSSPSPSRRSTPATKEFNQRSFRERAPNGRGPGRSSAQGHGKSCT